jgi:hypothetical protein
MDDRTQPTQRFIIASALLTFSLSNDHNASETTKRPSSSPYRRRGACCGRSPCTIQQLFDKCLGYRLVASLLIMWKAYQQTHAGTTPSRSKQGGSVSGGPPLPIAIVLFLQWRSFFCLTQTRGQEWSALYSAKCVAPASVVVVMVVMMDRSLA